MYICDRCKTVVKHINAKGVPYRRVHRGNGCGGRLLTAERKDGDWQVKRTLRSLVAQCKRVSIHE